MNAATRTAAFGPDVSGLFGQATYSTRRVPIEMTNRTYSRSSSSSSGRCARATRRARTAGERRRRRTTRVTGGLRGRERRGYGLSVRDDQHFRPDQWRPAQVAAGIDPLCRDLRSAAHLRDLSHFVPASQPSTSPATWVRRGGDAHSFPPGESRPSFRSWCMRSCLRRHQRGPSEQPVRRRRTGAVFRPARP